MTPNPGGALRASSAGREHDRGRLDERQKPCRRALSSRPCRSRSSYSTQEPAGSVGLPIASCPVAIRCASPTPSRAQLGGADDHRQPGRSVAAGTAALRLDRGRRRVPGRPTPGWRRCAPPGAAGPTALRAPPGPRAAAQHSDVLRPNDPVGQPGRSPRRRLSKEEHEASQGHGRQEGACPRIAAITCMAILGVGAAGCGASSTTPSNNAPTVTTSPPSPTTTPASTDSAPTATTSPPSPTTTPASTDSAPTVTTSPPSPTTTPASTDSAPTPRTSTSSRKATPTGNNGAPTPRTSPSSPKTAPATTTPQSGGAGF